MNDVNYIKKKNEYDDALAKAYKLLEKNNEWEKRYKGYITTINETFFPIQCRLVREVVQINWPLAAYLNISSVTKSGMNLDLRLYGTSIATLFVKVDSLTKDEYRFIKEDSFDRIDKNRINSCVKISFKDKRSAFQELIGRSPMKKTQVIKDEFICDEYWDIAFIDELLDGADYYSWHDKNIEKFRSIIKQIYKNNGFIATNEHAHESNILHLMNGKSEYFYAMKPVLLEKCFFQMPTPFKGSNAKKDVLEYASNNGGGIDILARKKLGSKNELCVIEIKDKYEYGEEPIHAIKQAISYAAFLMKLIQSDYGELWYRYFGINSPKTNCNINAVIAMPYKADKTSVSDEDVLFDNMVLDAGSGCTITLNYMYYSEQIFYSKEYKDENIVVSIKRDKMK